jgi:hypothetical protein
MLLARSVGSMGIALACLSGLPGDWRTGQRARDQTPRLPSGPEAVVITPNH